MLLAVLSSTESLSPTKDIREELFNQIIIFVPLFVAHALSERF